VAGSLLGDYGLVEEGRIGHAKIAQFRIAADLEAAGHQRSTEADREFAARQRRDRQRRSEIERQADEQEEAVARQAEQRRQQLEADAARKAEAARKSEQASKKFIATQQRTPRKVTLDAEQQALDAERRAVAAKSKAARIERVLDTTKAARKATRS
jgi:hypothetical protein